MKKHIFLLTILFSLSSAAYGQNTIQLTTYYPAPHGTYQQLRYFPMAEIGGPVCDVGTVYYDDTNKRLLLCNDDPVNNDGEWGPVQGVWTQAGDDIHLADQTTPFDKMVGIGTTTPEFKLTLDNDGGIIAKGMLLDINAVDLTTSGFGSRLIWWPKMAVFRAGYVTADQWDPANIGIYSVAFGTNNTALGQASVISGGANNNAFEPESTVGGGANNTAYESSVVAGGNDNVAGTVGQNSYATVSGGTRNIASARYTTVAGGGSNTIGEGNEATALWATVSGGFDNVAYYRYGTIGGGQRNTLEASLAGLNSTIGGGSQNIITFDADSNGQYSTIAGGVLNKIYDERGSIGGGYSNEINGGDNGTISGGGYNKVLGNKSTIGGGERNLISGSYGTIGGGGSSVATAANRILSDHGTISGGRNNVIEADAQLNFIGGGANNVMRSGVPGLGNSFSVIGGGTNNEIYASEGTIGGGDDNIIDAYWGFIGGGQDNHVGNGSALNGEAAVVVGGLNNEARGEYSSVLGGRYNKVLPGASYSVIAGGIEHDLLGNYSTISGGEDNRTEGQYTWVGGKKVRLMAGSDNTFIWDINTTTGVGDYITSPDAFLIFPNHAAGQVGIGVRNPQAKLDINGNIRAQLPNVFAGCPTGSKDDVVICRDGDTFGMHWENASDFIGEPHAPQNHGYDVAELFNTTDEVEVGDVLVIDDSEDVRLTKSRKPYDTMVAGIVSSSPAVLFEGSELMIAPPIGKKYSANKPPVALAGRVLVKVSLENGPIQRGDLLTTSSTPGHAMKATDRDRAFGAVLGKALQPFSGGETGQTTGYIMAIVTLQ